MKIWQKYLFKQLVQSFSFILISIVILYVIIDFSIRGVKMLETNTNTLYSVALNYLHYFAIYFDLFSSIAFLLSCLKVLIDCNTHQELTALQIGGLSKKVLLRPFFLLATLLFLASYANSQWFSPDAGDGALSFKHTLSAKQQKKERVFSLVLKDDSELIYQNLNSEAKELSDVYWLRSADDIWHMKMLKLDPLPPSAHFTDHLVRNKKGLFEKKESFLFHSFPELPWDFETTPKKFIPFENRPLLTLLKQAAVPSSEKQKILAHLHYKLSWPLFPFLILLTIAPQAFFFSRNKSSFFFVACMLFALIGLITLLNGMLILAENQVLPAMLAVWIPIGICFSLIARPFVKLS